MSRHWHSLIALVTALALVYAAGYADDSQATDRAQRRAQVGALLAQAQDFLDAEQYDRARSALSDVIELEPGNQDAYYYLAASHLAQGDEATAREVLTEGISKAPMSSRLNFYMARIHIRAGEYDEARQLVDYTLRFKPNNPEALYLRGMASLAQADTSSALADWETALDETVNGGKRR